MKIHKFLYILLFSLILVFSTKIQSQNLEPHLDSLSGKYGYKYTHDDSVWIIKPYNHDKAWAFSNNYARVKTELGFNFILLNSTYLSQQWFKDARDFNHHIAPVLHSEYSFVVKRDSIRFRDSIICQEYTHPHEYLKWNFIKANVTYKDSIIHEKVFKGIDSIKISTDSETNLPIKEIYRTDSVFVSDTSIVKIAIQNYVKLFENGFEKFHYIAKHYILVENEKKGLLSPQGKMIYDTHFEEIIFADTNLVKYKILLKKNDKWAIADTIGNVLTPFQYKKIILTGTGCFIVTDSTGTYVLKSDLKLLSKKKYSDILMFNKGFSIVKSDSLLGIIDIKGNEIVKPFYDFIGWKQDSMSTKLFVNHKIQTRKNGLWGMLTDKGKILIPNLYNEILPENELYIPVNGVELYGYHPEGVWGFYDSKGVLKVGFRYDKLNSEFNGGIAIVGFYMMQKIKPAELEIRLGLIDKSGGELTGFIYKNITKLTNELFAVQNNNNLWGFCNSKGKLIHECKYEEYIVLNDKQIKVVNFGKWGVVETDGKILYDVKYKSIQKDSTGWKIEQFNSYTIYRDSIGFAKHEFDFFNYAAVDLFIFGLNGYYGLIDTKGNVILKNSFNQIEPFKHGISVVKINGKYGVINKLGKYVLEPEFEFIERDTLGFLRIKGKEIHDYGHVKVVVSEVPRWGIYDSLGQTVLEIKHSNILPQTEGIFPVKRGNLWGYFNINDDQIIPFQFTTANHFKHGLAIVNKDNLGLLINKNGDVVNQIHYDSLGILGPQTILFLKNNKYGLINHLGVQILEPCYESYKLVASSVILFKELDSLKTLVNYSGTAFWSGFTDSISENWIEDMLVFKADTAWKVYNKNGIQVLPVKPHYEKIEQYSNEYARMTYGGKLGFIDKNGKLRISNQYDEINHFHEDMCAFKLLGKWGYIDKAEHIWTQPFYEKVLDFQGGLGAVYKNGKWGFVDKLGKEVTKLLYSEIRYDGNGFYAVKRNNSWGMVNASLGEFLFTKYDEVQMLGTSYVKITSDGKFGAANLNGELIVPFEYDAIEYDDFNKTVLAIIKPKY